MTTSLTSRCRPFLRLLFCLTAFLSQLEILAAVPDWKAGLATIVITPKESMWLGGYASRKTPSAGKIHDLHAKALAIQDRHGSTVVLVTADLVGIPRTVRDFAEQAVLAQYKLSPQSLMINASHTHSGPELREDKIHIYALSPQEGKKITQYATWLQDELVGLVGSALEDLQPASLAYTHGRAGFAMNRRLPVDGTIKNKPYADGPVDHDVPVLTITSPEGKLRGIMFGYACHNTTVAIQKFCGDYAGFAQAMLEQSHPKTIAMFVAGCGGDQNPQPRRTLKLAQQHGRALANGVEAALISPVTPLKGTLATALEIVPLEFAEPPTRSDLERQAASRHRYEKRHAKLLLQQIEKEGQLPRTYPYPMQVIRIGDDLLFAAMAGEVVVDYSLRLKQELAGPNVWIAGYCNDLVGYIPSARVLAEGGYEAGGAMVYISLPGPWAPTVEKQLLAAVHRLAKQTEPSHSPTEP